MAKREFLLLAHPFDAEKHGIGGWFMSEKLDGMRAFWDGGITRGVPKKDVPFANTAKDHRYKKPPIATGLWSRYGNVIHAPDWWLDKLPKIPLDGELYTEREMRQTLFSVIKDLEPGPGWEHVSYHVFDLPPLELAIGDGQINCGPNFKKFVKNSTAWVKSRIPDLTYSPQVGTNFESVIYRMQKWLDCNETLRIHPQTQLPFQTKKAMEVIDEELDKISAAGGEGLMLRAPHSTWIPERSKLLLKVKKRDDDEGIVIGYTTGRETDKGSKLLGLMGALVLDWKGKRLELSGFSEAERVLAGQSPEEVGARTWAETHPGVECPAWIHNSRFPRGSAITFTYRGLSEDGIPQEAQYKRVRDE
jgi:DNA ligase-1